jgi:PPIC-type PPIASE domain
MSVASNLGVRRVTGSEAHDSRVSKGQNVATRAPERHRRRLDPLLVANESRAQLPAQPTWWQRAAREPLLHFVLLGGLVFGLHQGLARTRNSALVVANGPDPALRVDRQKREELAALFAQRMQRKPSEQELEASVARWLEEEMLFREALRLELPEHDPDLRDQLIARMRSLLQAASAPSSPREDELRAYHAAHRERYRLPATATFVEYLVLPGARAEDSARALLRRLQQAEPVSEVPVTHSQRTDSELSALYGSELATKVRKLPLNAWQLLRSARGLHVVQLTALSEASDPPREQLRSRLSADLGAERARVSFQEQLTKLAARWQLQADAEGHEQGPARP